MERESPASHPIVGLCGDVLYGAGFVTLLRAIAKADVKTRRLATAACSRSWLGPDPNTHSSGVCSAGPLPRAEQSGCILIQRGFCSHPRAITKGARCTNVPNSIQTQAEQCWGCSPLDQQLKPGRSENSCEAGSSQAHRNSARQTGFPKFSRISLMSWLEWVFKYIWSILNLTAGWRSTKRCPECCSPSVPGMQTGVGFPTGILYPSQELIAGRAEGGKAFVASACCRRVVIGLHCIFADLAEFIFSFT